VPRLIQALSDYYFEVRRSAVEALGRIGPAAAPAVPDLIQIIQYDYFEVRRSVAEALGRTDPNWATKK
jgi:HEAT repeat protein